jgi:hypothetical protein
MDNIRDLAMSLGKVVRGEIVSKSDYNFNLLLLVIAILILLIGLSALGALMMFLSAFM